MVLPWWGYRAEEIPRNGRLHTAHSRVHSDEQPYQIERALAGGGASVYRIIEEPATRELVDSDEGQLLVQLAGAEGRALLRSASKKGAVTAGDLRHWSLLSQPGVISESPTSGTSHDQIQRISAFNLFLTGSDDEAIQVTKSPAEVERIKGQLSSAEDALKRVQAGLEAGVTRKDLQDSFERVNSTLAAMNDQYEARAAKLKTVRTELAQVGQQLREATTQERHSASMVERFELLEKKYASDLERLGATNEGVSFFEALVETACPLCGTAVEKQLDPHNLRPDAPAKYRAAIAAEARKISLLRAGLVTALKHERERLQMLKSRSGELNQQLGQLEQRETRIVNTSRTEFSANPKTLAERHSALTAQLGILDEVDRLTAEIEKLKKQKVRKRVPISRYAGDNARAVADFAKELLHEWGFADIQTVEVDTETCDLRLNDRERLSFGAGKRAIFLSALVVALLRHAVKNSHPHLGVVIIDSPLKAYADPKQTAESIPASTVTEKFYAWLAGWSGPGQLVVLENEAIDPVTARLLQPIEFTRLNEQGRPGFYPITITPPPV